MEEEASLCCPFGREAIKEIAAECENFLHAAHGD